ncbi:Pumilio-family RNA binding repeat, putative [Angomonas deanei]|uniref:Pumilio-family RNA binding repeat, putative n=1 Tax=Angomonas deanei TaxID=59799 RepID=A0A7G2C6S2_9TRYP|nr:Pumilio-family RNA binding repeat, putative [Angomonas deanei]
MELREVNVNINTAASALKKATATYIQPPRSIVVPKPVMQQQQQPAMDVAPPNPYGYSAQEMLSMAEASYAECPCPTCAYYRAYYTAQVHGAPAAPAPRASFSSTSSIPLMSVKTSAQQSAAQSGPIYADPSLYEGPSTMMNIPRAAAPRPARQSLPAPPPPSDPVAAFHAQCAGHVVEAACSPQGKTLLQAAIRTQDPSVLEVVVAELCEDLETAAIDPNGCHVVRAVIETCSAEQTASLVGAMHETLILNMATVSQYTRRILQSLFERQLVDLSGVVDVLSPNASYLAATQQGCIALMRVYEQCDATLKAILIEPLLPLFSYIALDPFGNYVVQCAIEHSGEMVAAQYTVNCFAGRLLPMSCDKFASNVVEKIIRTCGHVPAVRRMLLDELIYNPASLQEMVNDGYGNFVVQSIIDSSTSTVETKRIADRLRPTLMNSPYATRIEAKLKGKKAGPAAGNGHPYHNNNNNHHNNNAHHHRASSSQELLY